MGRGDESLMKRAKATGHDGQVTEEQCGRVWIIVTAQLEQASALSAGK